MEIAEPRRCQKCGEPYEPGRYREHSRDPFHRSALGERSQYHVPRTTPTYAEIYEGRDQQIATMLRDNLDLTLQDVGDAVGMTRERVRQIGKRYGVVRRQQLATVYRDGTPRGWRRCQTCNELVLKGKEHIYAHVRSTTHLQGKLANPHFSAKSERNQRMVELYLAGVKTQDIPRLMIEEGWPPEGLFQEVVYRLLRRYGYEPSRGGGHYRRDRASMRDQHVTAAVEAYVNGSEPIVEITKRYWPDITPRRATQRLYAALRVRGITFRRNSDISIAMKARMARIRAEIAENSPEIDQTRLNAFQLTQMAKRGP